jgi:hypothetical protein
LRVSACRDDEENPDALEQVHQLKPGADLLLISSTSMVFLRGNDRDPQQAIAAEAAADLAFPVIDTIAAHDPTRYFMVAPPLSEEAHYVERLRKTSADRIEAEFTIEDIVTLTGPLLIDICKSIYRHVYINL